MSSSGPSTSPASPRPFRVFSCTQLHEGVPVALGRNHASWFIVYATPHFSSGRRTGTCVNFIAPGDLRSVGAVSSDRKLLFTVGGRNGKTALDVLLCMRDEHGSCPISVVRTYPETEVSGILAEIEVQIPKKELVYACARCGRWETLHGPRFRRCGGCKSRYYCSPECQRQDWAPSYHRDECSLLKSGKALQVEERRNLHDNGWWFDHGYYGDYSLLTDNGEYTYARALETLDYDFLSYGRRSPPRDVPPTPSSPTPRRTSFAGDDDVPAGFIPADGPLDRYLLRLHRFRNSPALAQLSYTNLRAIVPNNFPSQDVPAYPPLPVLRRSWSRPSFVRTGDPSFDELRMAGYLQRHGTRAERRALAQFSEVHEASIKERQRLAEVQRTRACENAKLLLAHLVAAEDVFLLAAGNDPAAYLEAVATKRLYEQISARLSPSS